MLHQIRPKLIFSFMHPLSVGYLMSNMLSTRTKHKYETGMRQLGHKLLTSTGNYGESRRDKTIAATGTHNLFFPKSSNSIINVQGKMPSTNMVLTMIMLPV